MCAYFSVCDQEKATFTNLKGLECNFSIMRQFDDSFNLIEWDSSSFVALGKRHQSGRDAPKSRLVEFADLIRTY